LIILRAVQAKTWLDEDCPEIFLADDKTKLATYKAFQEAVEASLDIVAMICKDLGLNPKDDYSNLDRIVALRVGSKDAMNEANGLRNHLIHRYNKRDDQLAMQSMKDLLPGVLGFVEEVEGMAGEDIVARVKADLQFLDDPLSPWQEQILGVLLYLVAYAGC
jgi:uncharacterized protein YutE (UPF0331/DUF86 family)